MRYHCNIADMALGQVHIKRLHEFITSGLKGEGGTTYDAIGDAAYFERVVELENEYDCNFSIHDIPEGEIGDEYNRILDDCNTLRATAALAFASLLTEPAPDEEEVVQSVAPVKVRALYSHEGCKNQFQAGGLCSGHGAQQRACSMEGCMRQAQK